MLGAYGRSKTDRTALNSTIKPGLQRSFLRAYNRQYYEDQVCHMGHMEGVVMIDADGFKTDQ